MFELISFGKQPQCSWSVLRRVCLSLVTHPRDEKGSFQAHRARSFFIPDISHIHVMIDPKINHIMLLLLLLLSCNIINICIRNTWKHCANILLLEGNEWPGHVTFAEELRVIPHTTILRDTKKATVVCRCQFSVFFCKHHCDKLSQCTTIRELKPNWMQSIWK